MYADDTVIYCSHESIEQIEAKLQEDFESITHKRRESITHKHEKRKNRKYAIWN